MVCYGLRVHCCLSSSSALMDKCRELLLFAINTHGRVAAPVFFWGNASRSLFVLEKGVGVEKARPVCGFVKAVAGLRRVCLSHCRTSVVFPCFLVSEHRDMDVSPYLTAASFGMLRVNNMIVEPKHRESRRWGVRLHLYLCRCILCACAYQVLQMQTESAHECCLRTCLTFSDGARRWCYACALLKMKF